MAIRFDGRVAIDTGAGGGLGRSHALALAARGAKLVVNDFGGAIDGRGASSVMAQKLAEEIRMSGGEAVSHGADVSSAEQVADMVAATYARWGRVDILINNAGIVRDATFAKMDLADFQKVLDVHLMGSVICTKAVWPLMREANYGRILMTSSASGLYGNFGQANYGAAKMALVGLMNALQIEGQKNNIHVNTLAPAAATRMTEAILRPGMAELMKPESVTPAALFLVSEEAPRRTILNAAAGAFSRTFIHETEGVFLPEAERTPEAIAACFDQISDTTGQHLYTDSRGQVDGFLKKALAAAQGKSSA